MTALVRQNVFAAWLDGDVSAMEALRSLCADYEEIESSYKDFERIKEATRDQISQVMLKIGDKVEVKGFGVLTLTQPTITKGYDKRKIDALIFELIEMGATGLAEQLRACATQSSRAGALRIEREKPRAG